MTSRQLALILMLAALPAAAQMKSTRTILDAPPATTTGASDTPAADDPCEGVDVGSLFGKKFPTDSDAKKAACFFDQKGFQMLSGAQLISSGGSVAAATEVISDFFHGWRISFSTAIASEPEEESTDSDPNDGKTPEDLAEEEAATNLLQANGGNMALSFNYPIYAQRYGTAANGTGGFEALTYVRLGGTFDAFGGGSGGSASTVEFDDLNANAEWAVTTRTNLITVARKFNFEVYTNAGVIAGTKTFRANVGIDPTDSPAFFHGELGTHVRIGQSMLIGASWNYYSADGIDDGARVTIGFTR